MTAEAQASCHGLYENGAQALSDRAFTRVSNLNDKCNRALVGAKWELATYLLAPQPTRDWFRDVNFNLDLLGYELLDL